MNVKSFVFGIGCGLLFMSVFFYFIYASAVSQPSEPVTEQLTDSQITERAKQLGMVFLAPRNDEPDTQDVNNQPPASEPAEQAKIEANTAPPEDTPAQEHTEPEPSAENTPEGEPEPAEPAEPEPIEPAEPAEPEPVEPQNDTEPLPPAVNDDGLIRVVIPDGLSASQITNILYESGVITDTAAFIQYLADTNTTTRLKIGTYHFNPNESFEVIIQKMRF